jgi:MFS family permease
VSRARLAVGDTFRSLHSRNYRLFFFGQLVSLCGTWMQTVAIGWLVLKSLHGSGTTLGLIVAVQFLPTLVGGSWAGVIADRRNKRHIIIVTQSAMAVIAALLAVLTLTGVVRIWMVFAITLALGVATMFDNPTRQSFVTEMVGPEDLANAVGLNSAMFNAARVVGPALAGGLILAVGTGICFAFNAVSFVAVIGGLLVMRPAELFTSPPVARAKGQIREGLRYALQVPELRSTLTMVALIGTFSMNFTVVLPLIAKNTFHGDAGVYGLLSAAMGVGALAGSLVIARKSGSGPGLLIAAAGALGVSMCLAGAAPTLLFEYFLIGLAGMTTIAFMTTANITVQMTSRPDMRGRVMAFYMVLVLGSTPIGGPLVGWVAQEFGARWSLVLGGVAAGVAAAGAARTLVQARNGVGRLTQADPIESQPAIV